jgi:hypothetical protein
MHDMLREVKGEAGVLLYLQELRKKGVVAHS